MELVIKTSAAALAAAALALLIRKSNPELSLLVGISVTVLIITASLGFLSGLMELVERVRTMVQGSETLLSPVLKCLAVAIVTKMSADLCRDSSQSAAASALEFAGCICAMSISIPLILSVINMIGGFL